MARREFDEFRWYEGLAILLGCIAIQLSSELFAQWGTFFYSPSLGRGRTVYVAMGLVGVVFILGRIFDAVTDPLIGVWSDKTAPRPGPWRIIPIRGRRRPFVFWGSILMTFTTIAFWFPPVDSTSWVNLAYAVTVICLHWLVFTVCVIPFNSLGPEIARSNRSRVALGQWVAIGMILGLAIASIAPGLLIDALDPVRRAQEEGADPRYSAAGFQRTAIIFALSSLILFQIPVWVVRERFTGDEAPVEKTPAFREMWSAMRNPVFRMFIICFFLFMIGYLAVQRALPYWAEVGLGGDESTVSFLLLPFIAVALFTAFAVMPILSRLMSLKWMLVLSFVVIGSGLPMMYPVARLEFAGNLLPDDLMAAWQRLVGISDPAGANRALLGAVLFGYCGFGQGVQYVVTMPLIGQCIDLDERQTGRRREAVYNGVSGIAFKVGQAFSVLLATQCMNLLGHSVERPYGILWIGPIAGIFAVLGLIAALRYPEAPTTPET